MNGHLDGKPFDLMVLNPSKIKVLPQMRKTFDQESIIELAVSIKTHGQINECLINRVRIGRKVELQLIAGERRYRAINWLWEHKEYWDGKRKPKGVRSKVFNNLSPLDCFKLQVAENLHEQVPPHERAEAIYGAWELAQGLNLTEELHLSRLTVAAFARLIGQPEAIVRSALRFCDNLNPEVSKFVYDGYLSYSSAVFLTRVSDLKTQLRLAVKIMAHNLKKDGVERLVKGYLNEVTGGQTNILELLSAEDFDLTQLKMGIERNIENSVRNSIFYLRRLLYLLREGYLPSKVLTPTAVSNVLSIYDIREEFKEWGERLWGMTDRKDKRVKAEVASKRR